MDFLFFKWTFITPPEKVKISSIKEGSSVTKEGSSAPKEGSFEREIPKFFMKIG